MLDQEYSYYKIHKAELLKEYKNKYIVIHREKVVGIYNNEIEAYTETIKTYETGSFLIQHCIENEESTTQTFQSRVVFQ